MKKEIINSEKAPAPIGPYNQAVKAGGFLFTSGQIALDAESGQLIEGGIEEQARKVLDNLLAVLKAANADFNSVVKTTIFLKDMNDFAAVNSVYAEYFTDSAPARSTVEVARLPKDVLVEIDCIAIIQ